MSFTVNRIVINMDKPFLYVDYNELIDTDMVLLSQFDSKKDYFGNSIALYAGLEVIGYQEDENINGIRDDIIMEGICIANQSESFNHVKWLLKANKKSIRYVSDIVENGW